MGVYCRVYGVYGIVLRSLNLTGTIPPSLVDLPYLIHLDLSLNNFTGIIPPLGLSGIVYLNLSWNNLSGPIAQELHSHSLRDIDVSHNSLDGTLGEAFYHLPSLLTLSVGSNRLRGIVPAGLGNVMEYIEVLDLSNNEFQGSYPPEICIITASLKNLNLSGNRLGHYNTGDWMYLGGLKNCGYLQLLDVSNNGFNGSLSPFLTCLSSQMVSLKLRGNKILGGMPSGIQMLRNLSILNVGNTSLSGTTSSLSSLTSLKELILDHNHLYGDLSETLVSLKNLQILDVSHNHFVGPIPTNTSRLLVSLNLSFNAFNGTLPEEIGHLQNLTTLDVSYNNLSGKIPPSLANCKLLEFVILQSNSLGGQIPEFFGKMPMLKLLDLSFNDLEGQLPTGDIFNDLSRFRIDGNFKLCRDNPDNKAPVLAYCRRSTPTVHGEDSSSTPTRKSGFGGLPKAALAVIIVFAVIFFSLLLSCLFYKRNCAFIKVLSTDVASLQYPSGISYADLQRATEGFSSAKLIGSGGVGSVYRGYLERENKQVAVKVFNKETLEDAKSFTRECQSMRSVAHCNLVKILSYCANAINKKNQCKALVYELMPNGSLEMWLHQDVVSPAISFKRWRLRLRERLSMAIDVASALVHLHGQPEKPIVHGNLKPSNVLIADDMTAHVTDVGMSNTFAMDAVIGTSKGYVAPEYTKGSPIAPRWDVYSFGVLLLEMFTGKRPTDRDLEEDNMSLHDYVLGRYVPNVEDVIDPLLLSEETVEGKLTDTMRECFISIIHMALICSEELPEYRTDMKDALDNLQTVKKALQIGIDGAEEIIGSINSDDMMV